MDFAWAAENRERILAEWNKRYDARASRRSDHPRCPSAAPPPGGTPAGRQSRLPGVRWPPKPKPAAVATEPLPASSGIRKQFGAFTRSRASTSTSRRASSSASSGPSGCGKTTLLRIIAGLEMQSAGRIEQAGRDISHAAAGRSATTASSSSPTRCFPTSAWPTTWPTGWSTARCRGADRDARVTELVALVGLPGSEGKFPAQLSGGQQQRIALARALATSPGLLLLDEPLSALDAIVRVRLRGEIRSLQRKLGVTTIMVTHDQEEALPWPTASW
jgi:iron(III) transport system ATP-binding protein